MVLGQVVPEGLAAMPPGPELAALLDTLTPERVPNDDIGDVLVAQSRQLAHDQARMLGLLGEVVCRRPFAGPGEVRRDDVPEPYGADEVRAVLAWTRRAAESETDFAYILVRRLPLVFAALDEGSIDRGRAWLFVHHLGELTDAQIEIVCVALLPVAGRLTTGQLGERLRRMVLELDPDYYQRRYRKSVRERRVICYLDADGTATLSASGLPAEEAAAAIERVDALARAARRHGHPGTLDQIRADLILGLLDGSLHTLTRAQIIDALIGRYAGGDPDTDGTERTSEIAIREHPRATSTTSGASGTVTATTGTGTGTGTGAVAATSAGTGRAGGTGTGTGTGTGAVVENGDISSAAGSGTPCPDDTDDETGVDSVGGAGSISDADSDTGTVSDGEESTSDGTTGDGEDSIGAGTTADDAPAQAGSPAHRPPPEDQRVGVEIRVPLPTLIGHQDRAGELPGLGPVTADTARRAVARQPRALWRWVVVDTDGHLISEGITRRRPATMSRTGPRGGIVELQVTEADLAALAADPDACGEWADVIADIAAQHHERDPDAHLRDLDSRPGRRFPTAAQRRHVEVRDRTCTFPGCRIPAHRADADHTVDHHHGGPTVTGDLSPLCRHDHMAKTEGGWRLRQPEPGRFVWISPLGREYPIAPEPILPPVIDHTARDPDPSFDDPADPTEHPLELPARDRAPPHNPHQHDQPDQHDPGPEPGRGPRRRALDWSAPLDPDDPPPF